MKRRIYSTALLAAALALAGCNFVMAPEGEDDGLEANEDQEVVAAEPVDA